MNIVKPETKLINGPTMDIRALAEIARTCYKSESDIMNENRDRALVRHLIENGHHAMLEHGHMTFRIICDRGVSHEIVRHRLASYAQESTRYCNYGQDKHGGVITVVKPLCIDEDTPEYAMWEDACLKAEWAYMHLLKQGVKPENARSVLPTCLKTEIVMTANYREWRHFFQLRSVGLTGRVHPDMQLIADDMLRQASEAIPIIFEDIVAQRCGEENERRIWNETR